MKKILVVEDDPGISEVISLILTQKGFKIDTAERSSEVIKKVARFNPDLILMDILLAEDDGRDICQELKAHKRFNVIPVILMSAYPNAHQTVERCGADDFIAKPFAIEDLLVLVHKYMRF